MTKPHANIVSVIDYGPHKIGNRETLFYVMPLFDTTMRKLLKSNISSVALLDVLIGVMKGVEAAHARNVWHRDLKPENILANSTLAQVVVADWGIAHFSSEELFTLVDTGPQERLANFLYAAPEQRQRGRAVDHRADIYALGLMLNEIFTKDVPLGNGYRTIGEHDSAFAFLDDVVAAMRQHNPDERPPSLTAVLRDIHVRQEMYASAQKIAALERSPVESDPQDDPLLKEPATLVGVEDYVGQVLRLKISQPVTPQWVQSFKRQSHRGSILDRRFRAKEPASFQFQGDIMSIEIDAADTTRLIPHVKNYLRDGSKQYEQDVENERLHREEGAKRLVREELERENERRTVLENLRDSI